MSRTPAANKLSGEKLYAAIWDMLEKGGLQPSPANYDICHRYLTRSDDDLVARIDGALSRHGALTGEALDEMSDVVPKATPRQLRKLTEDASRQIAEIIDLTARSGQNATEFGEVLNAADFEQDPVSAVAGLVAATRTMIRKSEDLEDRIRKVSDEAQSLRSDLAEAQERAASDPLTGLANRRSFDAALKEAVDDSRSRKMPMAVAIVDIDHFKHINDNHGHDVGDRVIKYIADLLQTTQGAPFVGRYGGEEFVLIFRGIDTRMAAQRLEEVRQRLQDTPLKETGSGKPLGRVTFSAGVSGPPLRTTSTSMMKSADKALYRAKHQGRNQVEIAGAAE
jgi:diguanylate cyclase